MRQFLTLLFITIALFIFLLSVVSFSKKTEHNLESIRKSYIWENQTSEYVIDNYLNKLAGENGKIIWKELDPIKIDSTYFIEYYSVTVHTNNTTALKVIKFKFSYVKKYNEINVIKINVDDDFYSIKSFNFENLMNVVLNTREMERFEKELLEKSKQK